MSDSPDAMPDRGAVRSMAEFSELMEQSALLRRTLTEYYLRGAVRPEQIEALSRMLDSLDALPEKQGYREIRLDAAGLTGKLDLSYEITELQKDIYFLQRSEREFERYLGTLYPGFRGEVDAAAAYIHTERPDALIADRDGTVNNYCGRYASSVQSIYNAVFVTRFARTLPGSAVLLTSAPLSDHGLLSVNVAPSGTFVLAGSKGREFLASSGRNRRAPIDPGAESLLGQLNARLETLLEEPDYEQFRLIGSGIQHKVGETVVARQDIAESIPPDKSERFKTRVQRLVEELDPEGSTLSLSDTGKDLEITLARGGSDDTFDKGDGIRFLDAEVPLELGRRKPLVCGDTSADLPMLEAARDLAADLAAVFVTSDESLKARARDICSTVEFVSRPDVLVTAFNRAATTG